MLNRKGLSKPLLNTFFSFESSSLTLSKLKKFAGIIVARRTGKRAKYLPSATFYVAPQRLVKELKPFIEREIVSISDRRTYDKMFSALKSDELFKDIWKNEGKGLVVHVNRHKLLELAPEKKSIKIEALKILRNEERISVAKAIRIAKGKIEKS